MEEDWRTKAVETGGEAPQGAMGKKPKQKKLSKKEPAGKVYGIVAECTNARAPVALAGICNGGCRLTSKRVLLLLAP